MSYNVNELCQFSLVREWDSEGRVLLFAYFLAFIVNKHLYIMCTTNITKRRKRTVLIRRISIQVWKQKCNKTEEI